MANKIYQVDESTIWFVPAAASQAENEPFECASLVGSTPAGERSARYDFGTSARSRLFVWRAFVQFQATPVVGEILSVYAWTGDGTHYDNDDGTVDLSTNVSAEDKLRNCKFLGSIQVDQAAADIEMSASGLVELPDRYFAVIFWNATSATTTADDDENGFTLVPVPPEVQ